jgi:hypothetical protein
MAWSAKTSATQLVSITTEQFFGAIVGLAPKALAHVQVAADFPATPTDHAVFSVYTTLDDATEVWDLVPLQQFVLANSPDPNRLSFTVSGVYRFRVGVKRSGSTDTIASADLAYRTDGA